MKAIYKKINSKIKSSPTTAYEKLVEFKNVNKLVDRAVQLKKVQENLYTKKKKVSNDLELFKTYAVDITAPIALVFNVAVWKRSFIRNYLNEYRVIFVGLNQGLEKYEALLQISFIDTVIIIWGRAIPLNVRLFSESHGLPIYHLEDGFVRSVGLGSNHVLPLSLCLDKKGLYYDSSKESDLENILNNYDFSSNFELIKTARSAISFITEHGISKYNLPQTNFARNAYGPKKKKRILVIGQVEDDQSILYGCERPINNYRLLKLVIDENPGAQIIYKIHPDILAGKRKELSDISELMDTIEVININMSLNDSLYEVDHVYTITSLAGFEALMYGIKVTTIGAPFYSGWGLTDDRQLCKRRNRALTLEEVFAAAYILYPKYRTFDSFSESDITDTLHYIASIMHKLNKINSIPYIEKVKFYSYETRFPIDYRQITNLTADKVAIISDSIHSLELAESIVKYNMQDIQTDLITTRDALSNNEKLVNGSYIEDENSQVQITSIHKKYSVPLSKMERESVELSLKFSESLQSVLDELFGSFVDKKVLKHLAIGVSDYCYFEVLRFLGSKAIIDDYDIILLYMEELSSSKDIIQSIHYHANQQEKLNQVFVSIEDADIKSLLKGNFSIEKIEEVNTNVTDIKKQASSFCYDINHKCEVYEGEKLFVCGNIVNQNYAYSPSTEKIIEVVGNNFTGEIIFFNSGLTNKKVNNSFKKTFLDEGLYKQISVYEGNHNNFIEKYGEKYSKYEELFIKDIPNLVISRLNESIPTELIQIMQGRIINYCKSLQALVTMIIEVSKMISNTAVFYTSMERSIISRTIAELCKQKNIATVGVQPQIVSTSPRYFAPIVDKMGIIDAGQKKVLQQIGYEKYNTHLIGSVNIINRLKMLEQHDSEELEYEIFFAMQHSVYGLMMPALDAIKEIVKSTNYKVIIKPHPHQELPVYYKVRKMFADLPSVKVLSRESDTYNWLGRCKVVIGMFSSVLFESAIFGKDVIVTSFKEIDDSINMANQGIALEVTTQNELENLIKDFLEEGGRWKELQEMKKAYLDQHPYFKPPYSSTAMEQFIVNNLPNQINEEF